MVNTVQKSLSSVYAQPRPRVQYSVQWYGVLHDYSMYFMYPRAQTQTRAKRAEKASLTMLAHRPHPHAAQPLPPVPGAEAGASQVSRLDIL